MGDWLRRWRNEWTGRVKFASASKENSYAHPAMQTWPPQVPSDPEDADAPKAEAILKEAFQMMDGKLESAVAQLHGCKLFCDTIKDENTRQIARSNASSALVLQAMATYPTEAKLQGQCIGALAILTVDTVSVQFPVRLGFRVVLDAMDAHLHNAFVQERGCVALASLSNIATSGDLHAKIESMAHAALQGMKEHIAEERVQGLCWNVLSRLTELPGGRSAIIAFGGIEILEKAKKAHPI